MRLIDADELLTAFPVDDEPTLTKSCVRMTIKNMPTIEPQPEPCEDTISRQSAIQAAECIVDHHAITPYQTMRSAMDHLQRILRGMPSVQPEIIRCHSCKHWTRTIGEMRGFGLGICDFHNAEYVTCNGFCHWAERREQDG